MILLIFPLIVNLKRRVGTGDRNMHLGSKGLLHVSQLGQDLTSDHLLGVQLAYTLTVAGQAGEGDRPDDGGSAGTAAAALNNGDLGDAQFAGLSDHRVLGRLALFQNASSNGGVGDLLHILSTDHLLAHNLLQFSRERRAGLLDSVGEGSLLESLGHAGLSSLDVVSLVAVKVSAETALVSAVSGMFQLNSLAIVGNSVEGSFQNHDIISRPVDSVQELAGFMVTLDPSTKISISSLPSTTFPRIAWEWLLLQSELRTWKQSSSS